MNYHDFITIHLFSVIVFIANLLLFLAVPEAKKYKFLAFIGFILTGITGVILALRFGLTTDIPMPSWIIIKYASWMTMGLFTVLVAKKFNALLGRLYWPWLIVAFISVLVSVYKPL